MGSLAGSEKGKVDLDLFEEKAKMPVWLEQRKEMREKREISGKKEYRVPFGSL